MTEPHAPHARWMPAILSSVIVGLAVAGGICALGDKTIADVKSAITKEADERSKLAARVDALQSGIETISGQPKADADAINNQLNDANSKLAALNDRLTTLEKKPEPAPVIIPAPAAVHVDDSAALKLAATSGKPFASELAAWQKLHPKTDPQRIAPLTATAQSGIPSEAEMNSRLREALDDAEHSKKIDDVGIVGKINTHLSGLVSIKKSADAGPYAKLHTDVMRDDTDTLTGEVEKLSDEDRKPFIDWLAIAHARHDALAALATLTNAEAE